MTNPNDPINPVDAMSVVDTKTNIHGLTKRELFSAMAMKGILANAPVCEDIGTKAGLLGERLPFGVANFALQCADALIAALNK